MVKSLLSLFLLISLSSNVIASEKAIASLIDYGFKADDLSEALEKYPELKDLEFSSESLRLDGKDSAVKFYSEKEEIAYIASKSRSGFHIEKIEAPLEQEVKVIEGEIRRTLHETVLKDTGSSDLASAMAEAFKDDFTTTKGVRARSHYIIQVEQYYDEGRFIKYGNILTASLVVGKALTKKILQIDPETFSWSLLPENLELKDKPFYAPVKTSRVSSLFQLNRRHPVTRRHQPHNGIDFAALSGTAVFPALDGEIVTIARSRSKGKYITILHDNGYLTTYIHLKSFQKDLRVGMRVELDDQIGEVGRTGYATGAHLHFGIIKDGLFVNPIFLLKSYCYSEKAEYETLDDIEEDEPTI